MKACALYLALTRTAPVESARGSEASLGGKLLYAAELDGFGRAQAIAGNVAGCATLAATADIAAQRQSIREGVVDFLVTSLDEALRILKNEVRQRKTVAVCVGAAPAVLEREMIDRGVQPDLVFAREADREGGSAKFGAGTREVPAAEPGEGMVLLSWKVEQAPARWMPILDTVALGCMSPNTWERRWIRLSPRFLGRRAMGKRSVFCHEQAAKEIMRQFGNAVRQGEVGAEVSVAVISGNESTVCRMRPDETEQR